MDISVSTLFISDFEKLRKENPKHCVKTMQLVFGAMDAVATYSNALHGLGHPEALGENLSGCYSREITEKHRLVYRYSEQKDVIQLISCYGHYS